MTEINPKNNYFICDICGVDIVPTKYGWKFGHDAWPLADGRCCDICNYLKVIPARLSKRDDVLSKLMKEIESEVEE